MTTEQPVHTPSAEIPGAALAMPRASGRAATAWLWLLAVVVGLVGFAWVMSTVAGGATPAYDPPLLAAARSLSVPAIVWSALSESANIPLIVIGLGLVGWLFATHRRGEALVVLLLLAAVTVGSEAVKQLVARPRPSGTDPAIPGVVFSFPSGHTLELLTIGGILTVRNWRDPRHRFPRAAVLAVLVAWVALVGLARVALNAHYPSDVLAGLFGGLAALAVYGWLTRPREGSDPARARPDRPPPR